MYRRLAQHPLVKTGTVLPHRQPFLVAYLYHHLLQKISIVNLYRHLLSRISSVPWPYPYPTFWIFAVPRTRIVPVLRTRTRAS